MIFFCILSIGGAVSILSGIILLFPELDLIPINPGILLLILLLVIPIVLFLIIIIKNSEKCYFESLKNPNRIDDEQKEHHAIIISSSTKPDKKIGLFVGTDLLIQYFIRNSIPYQTYLSCPKRARILIQDEKTRFLYLFGHGFQGGLVFHQITGKNRLRYDQCNNLSKKKFIAQLHCNSGKEKSLCEICKISPKDKKCFILKGIVLGYNFSPDVWLSVKLRVIKSVKDLI